MDREHILDRKHFYHLPKLTIKEVGAGSYTDPSIKIEQLEYPRLRRYIEKRIPRDYSASQVLAIAQSLVSEVCQTPPLDAQTSSDSEMQLLSNCITAFLAHILFWSDGANGVIILNIEFTSFKTFNKDASRQEVFNIGLEQIYNNPSKFFKKFEPRISWYYSISQDVRKIYQQRVIDGLRTLDGGYKRTNLGLLKRNSASKNKSKDKSSENNFSEDNHHKFICPKNVEEALVLAGQGGDKLAGLKLLHDCFVEKKNSEDNSEDFDTQDPKPEHYQRLLERYQERYRSAGVNFEIVDLEQVKQLLDLIAKSFREYKQLKPISLELQVGDETTLGELQADPQHTNVIENLEKSEIQELAFKLLDKHEIDCKLLLFLDGLNLTQKEAGPEVDSTQYTISRTELPRLLSKLARELHAIDPDSSLYQGSISKIIEDYINYLKDICKDYYPELLKGILAEIVKSAPSGSNIERLFIAQLQKQWQFKFKPDGAGLRKAAEFVQRRTTKP